MSVVSNLDGACAVTETTPRDVNEIPDADLLCRVVRSGLRCKREGMGVPRWERVSRLFGLGSTFSQQLCRRFGMDPDERVRR